MGFFSNFAIEMLSFYSTKDFLFGEVKKKGKNLELLFLWKSSSGHEDRHFWIYRATRSVRNTMNAFLGLLEVLKSGLHFACSSIFKTRKLTDAHMW